VGWADFELPLAERVCVYPQLGQGLRRWVAFSDRPHVAQGFSLMFVAAGALARMRRPFSLFHTDAGIVAKSHWGEYCTVRVLIDPFEIGKIRRPSWTRSRCIHQDIGLVMLAF
jgi:hypothetical protein